MMMNWYMATPRRNKTTHQKTMVSNQTPLEKITVKNQLKVVLKRNQTTPYKIMVMNR